MTPFVLYPFPSPKCTLEVWDQMLTSFILPIVQTISDEGRGCVVQTHRTNKSRIRLACFPDLHSFAVICGLCSLCTAQLLRLGSFHGGDEEDAGLWKWYFVVEPFSVPDWQFGWHIHGRVSHCLVEPLVFPHSLTIAGFFLHVFGDFGVTWGFSPDTYWAKSHLF